MQVLLDFLPILLFFGAYKFADIYVATGVLMAATVLQSAYVYRREGRLPRMQQATLILVLLFGALTLALHDERFIKWKPTVLYGAMGLALAAALAVWKKNLLQMLLGTQLRLPEPVWARLTVAWVGYFVFMAAANAYVALLYSTETWVNFKLWGYAFPLLFIVAQAVYIARHLPGDDADPPHV